MFLLILAGIEFSSSIVVYGTIFWICDWNGVSNTGMFSHCWAALTQHLLLHPLLLFYCPTSKLEGDRWRQLTQGIFHTIPYCSATEAKEEVKKNLPEWHLVRDWLHISWLLMSKWGFFCITCFCFPLGLRGKGYCLLWGFFSLLNCL